MTYSDKLPIEIKRQGFKCKVLDKSGKLCNKGAAHRVAFLVDGEAYDCVQWVVVDVCKGHFEAERMNVR